MQSWVKPEVDPPIGYALPRDSFAVLILNLPPAIEPLESDAGHGRDACVTLQKSKRYRLLVSNLTSTMSAAPLNDECHFTQWRLQTHSALNSGTLVPRKLF
jgi:hypothetical protein